MLSADALPTPTSDASDAKNACRPTPTASFCRFYRLRQCGCRFVGSWQPVPAIPMPPTPVLTDILFDNFQVMRCAAAVRLWSETVEDLGAGCLLHPDVHGLPCLMPERSCLANAPWKPRNGALVPAAVWLSPHKSCRSWLAPRRGGEPVADRAAAAVAL